MKLIGLLITVFLIGILFAVIMKRYRGRTQHAMQTVQQVEQTSGGEIQSETNPIDYSKQKAEEFENLQKDRADEINQLP